MANKSTKSAAHAKSPSPSTMVLRIELQKYTPLIWREVLVPIDIPLDQVHLLIQEVMDWESYHLHEFVDGENRFGEIDEETPPEVEDENGVALNQLLPRKRSHILYAYDFGDGWQMRLTRMDVSDEELEHRIPRVIAGKRAAPPEDSGGVWGYREKLKILARPRHSDFESTREWMGKNFDPDKFDLEKMNRKLQKMSWPGPRPKPAFDAGGKKIGRNEPCPCGSGKKYKKCCEPLQEKRPKRSPPAPDFRVAERLANTLRKMHEEEESEGDDETEDLFDEEGIVDEAPLDLLDLPRCPETWQVGVRQAPFIVRHPEPYHPELMLVADAKSNLVLGNALAEPKGFADWVEPVREVMFYPYEGDPRRPACLVVDSPGAGGQLREAFKTSGVEVVFGKTDKVDQAFDAIVRKYEEQQKIARAGYLQDGKISVEVIRAFFKACAELARLEPWSLGDNNFYLKLGLTDFTVPKPCVLVMGRADDAQGLAIYDDEESLLWYLASTGEEMSEDEMVQAALDVPMRSLFFEDASEVSQECRKEAMLHGFEVANPRSFPRIVAVGQEVMLQPIDEQSYRLVTLCAEAVAALCRRTPQIFIRSRGKKGPYLVHLPSMEVLEVPVEVIKLD